VIDVFTVAALVTFQAMAAERGGAAVEHGPHDLGLRRGQAVGVEILCPEGMKHLRQGGGHGSCSVAGSVGLGQGRKQIEGICGGGWPPLGRYQVQIVASGGQRVMTEQFLERYPIDPGFQQMGREAMALMPSSALSAQLCQSLVAGELRYSDHSRTLGA
jgi:hypothetical protein